jgi:hypothetical protein
MCVDFSERPQFLHRTRAKAGLTANLANGMHNDERKEQTMSDESFVRTAICTDYEKLLEECQRSLRIWNERRAETYRSSASGRAADNELRKLQADYATAYTLLQKHIQECFFCKLVARIENRSSRNDSSGFCHEDHHA